MTPSLREALRNFVVLADKEPPTWAVEVARAALAAPDEGRAERIEKAATEYLAAFDATGDLHDCLRRECLALAELRASLLAAPASPEPRPPGGQAINEATAIGLDLAADLLASWWDDGEQTPKGFDPQQAAEVVMLRSQAKKMRARAASPEPRPAQCGAEHPVFVYPCHLAPGHAGPHDNGSGDPWETT